MLLIKQEKNNGAPNGACRRQLTSTAFAAENQTVQANEQVN